MKRVGVLLGALLMALNFAVPSSVSAQEITPSHLRAAWEAIRALGVNDEFDQALPDLSTQVQGILMQRRPDLSRQITATVNQVALDLVPRRRELNDNAARIWAMQFTEAELIEIAAFYNGETGQKLAATYPAVLQETVGVFEEWYQALANEMLRLSVEAFREQGIQF